MYKLTIYHDIGSDFEGFKFL